MRRFYYRLKSTLLFDILRNNYFILVALIILLLVFINSKSIFVGLIFIGYLVYLLKKAPKLALYCIIILVIVFLNYKIRKNNYSKNIVTNYDGIAKVERIQYKNDNYQIQFKVKNYYLLYYSDELLEIGGIYYLNANISKPSKAHFPGGFDYAKYCEYKGIVGIIENTKIKKIRKSFSIYYLNYLANNYFDKHFNSSSKGMLKALTIGNKDDMEQTLSNSISNVGISHLFVISGLHVQIIAMFFSKILKLLHVSEKKQNTLLIAILFTYFVLTGFMISVFRVVYGTLLRYINKVKKLNYNSLDIMSVNIITVLVINPLFFYQYSFSLSYIISTSIIICSDYLKVKNKIKDTIINSIKISIIATLVTLPIVINIKPEINYLSIIYNIFYIPVVTYIILPMAFITTFFNFLEPLFDIIYQLFTSATNCLSTIKTLTITYPTVSMGVIIGYYWVLYFLLKEISNFRKKKTILLLVLFIAIHILWNNYAIFHNTSDIYFLDLPKGEATVVIDKHNKLNVLIDTGEAGYDDILIFLKKKGIKRLDGVIISHGDSDHMGMLEVILKEFKVKKVFCNKYDTKTMTIVKQKTQLITLKKGDMFKVGSTYFQTLSPKNDENDTNNNSLVLLMSYYKKKILLTGDIEQKIEKELPKIGHVDILKVPHHGSNTSSSNSLFASVDFEVAVCMNGYRNSFAFPTDLTRKKYQKKLYVTSENGTYIIRQ